MEQPTQTQEQPPPKHVLGEIAGGYLLGATIVSFLSLWLVGMTQALQSL